MFVLINVNNFDSNDHGYFISLSSFQPESQKIACYLVTKSKLLSALAMHAF